MSYSMLCNDIIKINSFRHDSIYDIFLSACNYILRILSKFLASIIRVVIYLNIILKLNRLKLLLIFINIIIIYIKLITNLFNVNKNNNLFDSFKNSYKQVQMVGQKMS